MFVFLIHWNLGYTPAGEVFVSSFCVPVGKFGTMSFLSGVSGITKVTDSWYLCKWFSLDFLWYLTIQIIKFWIHLCIYCNCYSNILKIVLNHHSLEPYTPIKMEYPMKSKHVAAKNVNKRTGVFTHFVNKCGHTKMSRLNKQLWPYKWVDTIIFLLKCLGCNTVRMFC